MEIQSAGEQLISPKYLQVDIVQETDVRDMFDAIAYKYDMLNRLLSFGVDVYWRKKQVQLLHPKQDQHFIDVATGTGDVGFEILKQQPNAHVVGIDFSENMVEIGRKKAARKNVNNIIFKLGNAQCLDFEDNHFDGLTISFGIRNVKNRSKTLSEFYRILKPNGMLTILEFGNPRFFLFRWIYRIYSKFLIPLIGRVLSRHNSAYTYLPQTISEFPKREFFLDKIKIAGFNKIGFQTLTNGVVTLFWGRK